MPENELKRGLKPIRSALQSIARADTVFYLLPLLMLLLVVGTLAQKPLGLYAAQKIFFSGFIIWAGFIPLPGAFILIGIIALSLAVKFLFASEWAWRKAGINLAHLGVLVLLCGGLLTAMLAKESFMVIPEGTPGQYLYDYHQRTLYIFRDNILAQAIPYKKLNLRVTGLPFDLKILNTCDNCSITRRGEDGNFKGMARAMTLKSMSSNKDPEADIPGLTFEIAGLKDQDGTYIAFEGMPRPIILYADDAEYKIIFGKQQTALPFSIRLNDFVKETYAGTDKAKAYRSDITILDNGLQWPARIEMNAPLRYKGYTFYQSSFAQMENSQATILSVVENKGRFFPYIGTVILAAGLLLHLFIVLRERAP